MSRRDRPGGPRTVARGSGIRPDVWYTYGMTKTTVYLPDDLKRALTRVARRRRMSEAELLREAVSKITSETETPAPRLPLFRSKGPSIAEDVDRALTGFGAS